MCYDFNLYWIRIRIQNHQEAKNPTQIRIQGQIYNTSKSNATKKGESGFTPSHESQFFWALYLGPWSDQGRKPTLLLPFIGHLISGVVPVLVVYYEVKQNYRVSPHPIIHIDFLDKF